MHAIPIIYTVKFSKCEIGQSDSSDVTKWFGTEICIIFQGKICNTYLLFLAKKVFSRNYGYLNINVEINENFL